MDEATCVANIRAYGVRQRISAERRISDRERLKDEAAGLAKRHPGAPDYVKDRRIDIDKEIKTLSHLERRERRDADHADRGTLAFSLEHLSDVDWMDRNDKLYMSAQRHGLAVKVERID